MQFCQWDKEGKCINCKFKLDNFNPNIDNIRLCRIEATNMALLYTKDGNPCFLKNIFAEQSIFYIGAGPSLKQQDLSFLSSRGFISVAVNNVAAKTIRPNIWICVDEPHSFHEVIWKDPAIMKLIPEGSSGKPHKVGKDQKFADYAAFLNPNVFLFRLVSNFRVATFLESDDVSFGCSSDDVDDIGVKGCRSVMLATLKLLWWFGFKNVFLLGCDFYMSEEPYCFEQVKHKLGQDSNNEAYTQFNKRYIALEEKFRKVNFNVYNCTPNSKLTAFRMLDLEAAKEIALKYFPRYEPDLSDMYGK